METNQVIFLGIDVSKLSLDISLDDQRENRSLKIQNQLSSIRSFFKTQLKKYPKKTVLVCMENTGYYNWHLYEVIARLDRVQLYVVNPLHLKQSMGMSRGKTDQLDATRICRFLRLHFKEMQPTAIPRPIIRLLQAYLANRNRFIAIRCKLMVPLQELALFAPTFEDQTIKAINDPLLAELDKCIARIEATIIKLIKSDQQLDQLNQYIQSVPGVGPITAWYLLVKTNEFISINDPRKLACYAGVVPFTHQSGTSINRRPRVSFMADKILKKLLHMGAMRAARLDGELKAYYQRKIGEGKNKMLVLNAIRNKILARVCSVVNNQRLYQPVLILS